MSGHRLIESWKVAAYLQIPVSALLVVLIALAVPGGPWILFPLAGLLALLWLSTAVYGVAFEWGNKS